MAMNACVEPVDNEELELELITTVTLTFTPDAGGAPVVASFRDVDGIGGEPGTSEPITLALGVAYTLDLAFLNEGVTPTIDITAEIEAEAEDHWVLLHGPSVRGPASTSSTALVDVIEQDLESTWGPNAVGDDLPVGLLHAVAASAAGQGAMNVMLRHLPELNGAPQKVAGLPAQFAAGQAIAGDSDVEVEFPLTVVAN